MQHKMRQQSTVVFLTCSFAVKYEGCAQTDHSASSWPCLQQSMVATYFRFASCANNFNLQSPVLIEDNRERFTVVQPSFLLGIFRVKFICGMVRFNP
jgi:hypothetical protein